MDFDIILNTCKQRQDFKVYIDTLVNNLNDSQNFGVDMSFSKDKMTDQELLEKQESLFNENSMFSHRESFSESKSDPLENLSISSS